MASCSWTSFAGVLRGNTLRGNTTPALRGKWHSERVSERASEKPLKTSENLSNPLKTSETLPLRDPLRDPLRGRFPSQNLSVLLPLFVLPLETPTIVSRQCVQQKKVGGCHRRRLEGA